MIKQLYTRLKIIRVTTFIRELRVDIEDRLVYWNIRDIRSEKIPGGIRFQYMQVKDKKVAERIEKQIIKKEKPRYNVKHK